MYDLKILTNPDPDLRAEKIAWEKKVRAKKRIESEKEREGELKEIEEARKWKDNHYRKLVDNEEDMKSNQLDVDDELTERERAEQAEEDFM